MKLPFFLRKKKNIIISESKKVNLGDHPTQSSLEQKKHVLNEREKILSEFNQDDLQFLFSVYKLDKDSISFEFIKTLKNNPDLLNYLTTHFWGNDFIKKINQQNLSIHDLKNYDKKLLSFDIFIKDDQELLDVLRKNVNVSNIEYASFNFEDYQQKINNIEIKEINKPSFVEEHLVIDKYSAINLNRDFIYLDKEINIAFGLDSEQIFTDSNDIFNYYYSGNLSLDQNTILFIPYNKFLEWSKDNTNRNLLKRVSVIIKDDYEKLSQLSNSMNWFYKNYHASRLVNDKDVLVAKTNHLLYLIENSNLNLEDKDIFKYQVTKNFQALNAIWNPFISVQSLKKVAIEIQRKLDKETIVDATKKFNQLVKEEKFRKIEIPKFSVAIFLKQFKNFENLSAFDFLSDFAKLNPDERKEALSNKAIVEKLRCLLEESAKDEYKYYARFMRLLDVDDVFKIFDPEFIKNYYDNHPYQRKYRFFYQLLDKDINKAVKYLLTDDAYFSEFMPTVGNLNLINLDYSLLVKWLKKLDGSGFIRNIPPISSVDDTHQFNLLKEDFSDDMLVEVVKNSTKKVQQFFYLEDARFHYLFKKFNTLNLIANGYRLADEVVHKKEFFDKFKDSSFVQFRINVNQFLSHQPNMFFEEKFINYEKELISNYDLDSGLFKQYQYILNNIKVLDNEDFSQKRDDYFYTPMLRDKLMQFVRYDESNNVYIHDSDRIVKYLQELSKQKLIEIIVDLLFQDNIYNVFLNIKEMLRFNNGLNDEEKVLDSEQIKLYETILNFDRLDNQIIINLFNKIKDKNMALIFYEDLQKVKNRCYDKIKKDLFQPEHMKGAEDKKLSSKYKVPIYDLRDRDYVILARCFNTPHSEKNQNRRDCYTLLSNENSDVINDLGYIYGYSGFDNDCILHMFEGDSFSGDVKNDNLQAGTDRVNRIMTTRELATNSHVYSEVQIVNKKTDGERNQFETLRPSFLIVYDKLDKDILEEAKKKNLPICILSHKIDRSLEGKIPFNSKLDVYTNEYWVENEDERRKKR